MRWPPLPPAVLIVLMGSVPACLAAEEDPPADASSDAGTGGAADTRAPGHDGSSSAGGSGSDHAPVPRFEPGPCRFDVEALASAGQGPACGDLVVWEDRATRQREVRLHLARFTSGAEPPGTPIVVLNGGPGGSTDGTILPNLGPETIDIVTGLFELVVFDQRGVGRSLPALSCPLTVDRRLAADELHAVHEQERAACRALYEAQGIDLRRYETRANADDVADLREALGYDALNLYGISYGSRLAQEVMRRHPESVEAVVLDAVVPADRFHFIEYPRAFLDALAELQAECNAEPDCGAAYPALVETFLDAAASLEAAPLALPSAGFELDRRWFVSDVYGAMFSGRFGEVPALIAHAAARDAARVEAYYARHPSILEPAPRDANGMNRSFTCSDRWQYVTDDDIASSMASVPPSIAEHFTQIEFELNRASCEAWPRAAPDPALLTPVTSDAPALLLSGTLDPRTPPSMARAVAEHLSTSQVLVVPRGRHGSITESCALVGVLAFFATPGHPVAIDCEGSTRIDFVLPEREGGAAAPPSAPPRSAPPRSAPPRSAPPRPAPTDPTTAPRLAR